jgi:hypothetical protein
MEPHPLSSNEANLLALAQRAIPKVKRSSKEQSSYSSILYRF